MISRREGILFKIRRDEGKKDREIYPELQINHKAYGTKCIIGRENGSCSLAYEGYVNGTYADSNLTKVFGFFVKIQRELPDTVSLDLENKIAEMDESSSILLAAVNAIHQQRREYTLSKLRQLKELLR